MDQADEFLAIAVLVVSLTRFRPFQSAFQVRAPFVRRIAQRHPERGDGGGEFEILGSVAEFFFRLLDREFRQNACVFLRFFAADLYGKQFVAVGQPKRLAAASDISADPLRASIRTPPQARVS